MTLIKHQIVAKRKNLTSESFAGYGRHVASSQARSEIRTAS
jgi:hypothetical protein